MKKFVNTLTSTDFKSILIKLSLFFILMVLSLISFYMQFVAFIFIIGIIIIERSYNSVIWMILHFICHPYAPYIFMLPVIIMTLLVLMIKFIEDIVCKRFCINEIKNVVLLITGFIIIALFMIPLTPNYSFIPSLRESVAVAILTIILINYDKIDFKTLMKVTAIFVAGYCIVHNFLGTFGFCHYRQLYFENVNRYSLFLDDPNYTAGIVLIALMCICILYRTKDIASWLFYTLFIVLGVSLMNTISKSGFFVYILFLITILIDKIKAIVNNKSRETKRDLLFLVLAILAVWLLSIKATVAMFGRIFIFVNFAPEKQFGALTTGRSDLILIYLKDIFDTPYEAIFGHGVQAPLLEFAPGDYRDTHCIATSMAYRYGLLISLLVIAMYIVAFLKIKQKPNWFNVCIAALLLLMYMSLSVMIFSQIYVFVFIFIFAVGLNNKTIECNE